MRLELIVHQKALIRGNAQGVEQFMYMALDSIPTQGGRATEQPLVPSRAHGSSVPPMMQGLTDSFLQGDLCWWHF
jgi:hypothetical protein